MPNSVLGASVRAMNKGDTCSFPTPVKPFLYWGRQTLHTLLHR